MSSFTTLVNIDAETGTKLAKFIGSKLSAEESASFSAQQEDFIAKGETKKSIELFLGKIDVFLSLPTEQEIEAAFQSLFSVLYIMGGDVKDAEQIEMVQSIISALSTDITNNSRRRLNALLQFFNLADSRDAKYELLLAIYNFAKATNQLQKISALHEKVSEWIDAWGLNETQQQNLFRTIATIFFEVGQKKRALEMAVQFLKSLDESISSSDSDAIVRPALVVAVNSAFADFKQRANLFEALGMQRLPGDLTNLSSLLRILCDGSVADWKAFVANADNESVLKKYDISATVVERKVRIFALASLAADSTSTNKTLTFANIAAALQISEDDVEEWVVEAIAEGVIQAAINQMSSTVTVHRFVQRSFGPAQWRSLGNKLEALKQRLQGALEKIETSSF